MNLEQQSNQSKAGYPQQVDDLADFVENAMVGLQWIAADGTILWANQTELDLLGYTREEYIGHHIAEFHTDRDVVINILKRLSEGEHLSNYDARMRCKDGSIKHVLINSNARFKDGQFVHSRCFTIDITERKKAEERITSLYQLAAAFAEALTPYQVAKLIVEQGIEKAGARAGSVVLLHQDQIMLEILASSGYTEQVIKTWQRFSIDRPVALAECVKSQQPIWLKNFDELQARYPTMIPNYNDQSYAAWAAVPLIVENRTIGGLGLSFSTPQHFEENDRHFIVVLAQQCALALERTRLAEEAQDLAIIEERQRIAHDLHDSVTQILFSASTMTEASINLMERQPQKVPALIMQVHQLIRGAAAELQFLLYELRPEMFDRSTLAELVTRLVDAAKARKQINFTLQTDGNQPFSHDVKVAIFRIVQELLMNIIKHSQATQATITLETAPAGVELRVSDNGLGFDVEQNYAGDGLIGMKERALAIGATLELKSVVGQGTEAVLQWQARQ